MRTPSCCGRVLLRRLYYAYPYSRHRYIPSLAFNRRLTTASTPGRESAGNTAITSVLSASSTPTPLWSSNRTLCADLQATDTNEQVTVCGWLESSRPLGEIYFGVIRDASSIVQVTINKSSQVNVDALYDVLSSLPTESVLSVTGSVRLRPAGMHNPTQRNGHIELCIASVSVLSRSQHPLPFDAHNVQSVNEDTRLRHRYLDLRRPYLQRLIQLRHNVTRTIRNFLSAPSSAAVSSATTSHHHHRPFLEIETPYLFKSTPEGAREFLVPTRQSGLFYALTQSPQQHKQLLMMAGIDRYYQIARCFRDESGRADRQPEFTQVDIEMNFVTQEDVMNMMELCIIHTIQEITHMKITSPIPRLSYQQAMHDYGSDKPDTRFDMKLITLSSTNTTTTTSTTAVEQIPIIRAVNCTGLHAVMSRKELNGLYHQLSNNTSIANNIPTNNNKNNNNKLYFITMKDNHLDIPKQLQASPYNITSQNIIQTLQPINGDLIVICISNNWQQVCEILGRIRLQLYSIASNTKNILPKLNSKQLNLLWIINFPLFEINWINNDNKFSDKSIDDVCNIKSVHHPFTAVQESQAHLIADVAKRLHSKPLPRTDVETLSLIQSLRAQHYDLVCNGVELGGGSIRIHNQQMQRDALNIINAPIESFRHLLEALQYGAPPHGGLAIGLDRFVAMLGAAVAYDEKEDVAGHGYLPGQCLPIRDVIAFPKSATGNDLLVESPSRVSDEQLAEFSLCRLVQQA